MLPACCNDSHGYCLELQCFAFAFSEMADARHCRGASVQPLLQLKAFIAATDLTLRHSEMRAICRNMGGALRRCQRALNAAWGISREVRGELSDKLGHLYDDMGFGC